MFGKLLSKLKKGDDLNDDGLNDDELDDDDDDPRGSRDVQDTDDDPDEDFDYDEEDGKVDVRAVAKSGGKGGEKGGGRGKSSKGRASASSDSQASSQKESSDEDSSDEPKESTSALTAEAKETSSGSPLDIDLGNIFDAEEVDEQLKDLAHSEEDVPAEDLASELRESLAHLERQSQV